MDPISWLMIAQAAVSIGGEIYNMGVNGNNYNVQSQRLEQQLKQQKDAYGLQAKGVMTQFNQAQQDIASSADSELVQRIQAGQSNAYDLSATGEALKSSRLAAQTSLTFEGMNMQMDNAIQSASTAQQDLKSTYDAQNVNSVLSIGATALGTWAGLEKRAGDLAGSTVGGNLFGPPEPMPLQTESPLASLPQAVPLQIDSPTASLPQAVPSQIESPLASGGLGTYGTPNYLASPPFSMPSFASAPIDLLEPTQLKRFTDPFFKKNNSWGRFQ